MKTITTTSIYALLAVAVILGVPAAMNRYNAKQEVVAIQDATRAERARRQESARLQKESNQLIYPIAQVEIKP